MVWIFKKLSRVLTCILCNKYVPDVTHFQEENKIFSSICQKLCKMTPFRSFDISTKKCDGVRMNIKLLLSCWKHILVNIAFLPPHVWKWPRKFNTGASTKLPHVIKKLGSFFPLYVTYTLIYFYGSFIMFANYH